MNPADRFDEAAKQIRLAVEDSPQYVGNPPLLGKAANLCEEVAVGIRAVEVDEDPEEGEG